MKRLHSSVKYEFLCSREFIAALNAADSQLQEAEQRCCREDAKNLVYRFRSHGISPVLEALDESDDSNLFVYHPDHAQDLSVVLAVEEEERSDFDAGTEAERGVVVFANVGKVNEMEKWAENQYYDFDPILARPLEESETEETILDIAQEKDFEAWKFFLHPEQKYFAHKRWDGPVYIAGAAGTGKTVIGLHYAATLARRYPDEKTLFTTKRSAVLKQFKERFRRFRKGSANVDFIHIDDIAYNVLKEERKKEGIDWGRLEADGYALWNQRQKTVEKEFFNDSYARIITGSLLEGLGKEYLRNEIEQVIIGGGITRWEDYCRSQRWGRLRPFGPEARELVWAFYSDWNDKVKQLDSDGCLTRYIDRIVEAQKIVARNEPQGRYRSAIIDEVQDMSLAGMKLVRTLVAGSLANSLQKDSMLILGDEAQQIFPGSFCRNYLEQINVDIGQRYHVLYSNYRNAEAIYDAARQVRGTDCVTGVKADLASVQTHLKGRGYRPQFIQVRPGGDKDFVGDKIDEILRDGSVESQHIGVLTRDRKDARALKTFLEQEKGFDCTLIWKGDDTGSGIRLGSFARTKGLEFRVVLIPYLARSRFPQPLSSNDSDSSEIDRDEAQENLLLERGYLYAAMTRARDQLYLIADEDPCEEIVAARACFDWREHPRPES